MGTFAKRRDNFKSFTHPLKQIQPTQTNNVPNSCMKVPLPLILGSNSPTRSLILSQLGIPFEKRVISIDEKAIGDRICDDPFDLVTAVAIAKANKLVEAIESKEISLPPTCSLTDGFGVCILTADQVVVCAGKILEKPESLDEAKAFASMYAISPASTHGAMVLTHLPSKLQFTATDTATVRFSESLLQEADSLVAKLGDECLSCAGGMMVENEHVSKYITSIDGDIDSVMGLSKKNVLELLSRMGDKLV